jgi:FkbM family methyltransferase
MKETMIFDQMNIFCLQESEAQYLSKEVHEYCQHGIQLTDQATVFDVGANIGVFALWLHQCYPKTVTVYSFEPIPAIFAVLKQNAQRFGAQHLIPLPYGLSNISRTANFTYYPQATVWSTAYPETAFAQREQTKQATLRNLENAPRWLRLLPHQIWSAIIELILRRVLRKVQQVSCQLKTVSAVIEELNIQKVDLLKIDVEYAELEVLLGIEPQDWEKIHQIVMEVHDIDNQVNQITTLLSGHNFNPIIVEQQDVLQGTNIFLIYARRVSSCC